MGGQLFTSLALCQCDSRCLCVSSAGGYFEGLPVLLEEVFAGPLKRLPPLGSILPLYPAPLPQLHFLKREWLKGVSVGTFPFSLKKQHKTLVARNEAFIVSTRDNAV